MRLLAWLVILLFACKVPGADTDAGRAAQATRASIDADAALTDATPGRAEADKGAPTSLDEHRPQGCFHADYVISRMPASYSPLGYPPAPERVSGQIAYCSATRFAVQASDHLAWRDGASLHLLWYWKDRSRKEALWYRLDRATLTPEEGPVRRRPSPAHYPGIPELSGGYALGVEYVGGAPSGVGIFESALRTLLGVGLTDSSATLVDGQLLVDTRDGCRLHYAKEQEGSIWRLTRECTDEIAKFHPSAVWQAGLKNIRPITDLTIPRATGAPQVHNHACEGAPEACNPWRPLTSLASPVPTP